MSKSSIKEVVVPSERVLSAPSQLECSASGLVRLENKDGAGVWVSPSIVTLIKPSSDLPGHSYVTPGVRLVKGSPDEIQKILQDG